MGARRLAGAWALAVAVVAAVAAGGGHARAQGADEQPPNIVVVMTDDQTQASVSQMPTVVSELAGHGTTFANNFTNWPLCCPSRSTFYTGQYAHNHGVLGNSPPDGGFGRFDDANTLPLWLQAAGYRTIHVGKYLNGYGEDAASATYVPPGWTEWYAASAGSTQSVYDYQLNQNGSLVPYGSTVADFKQDVFTNLAVDAINRNAPGGPFFLGVMYTAPHAGGPNPSPQRPSNCGGTAKPAPRHAASFNGEPLPVPASYNEADVADKPLAIQQLPPITDEEAASIGRRYRCRLESLLSVDDGVRRMIAALEAAEELDRTLIVFTSDNGFFAGEHRVRAGKNRVYEESVRVPLVIRGPGVPTGTVQDLSVNADLAPTIAAAAGANPGRVEDGRSLLPFAVHPGRLHGRELLFEKGNVFDDLDGDDDAVQSGAFAAVRTNRYVYVQNATGELELYDLARDPYQLANQILNPSYDAAESALSARLAALRTCAGPSCLRKPDLRLKLSRSHRQHGRSCRRPSRLLAKVRGSAVPKVVRVDFGVGPEAAGHDTSRPLEKRLRPRLLRGRRKPQIRATAALVDGRALSLQTRTRICG
jgi:arylsulfatase A-like enzyme